MNPDAVVHPREHTPSVEELKSTDEVLLLAGGFTERPIYQKRLYDLQTRRYIDENDPNYQALREEVRNHTGTSDAQRIEKEGFTERFVYVTQRDENGDPIPERDEEGRPKFSRKLSGPNPAQGRLPEKGPTFVHARSTVAAEIVQDFAPDAKIVIMGTLKPGEKEILVEDLLRRWISKDRIVVTLGSLTEAERDLIIQLIEHRQDPREFDLSSPEKNIERDLIMHLMQRGKDGAFRFDPKNFEVIAAPYTTFGELFTTIIQAAKTGKKHVRVVTNEWHRERVEALQDLLLNPANDERLRAMLRRSVPEGQEELADRAFREFKEIRDDWVKEGGEMQVDSEDVLAYRSSHYDKILDFIDIPAEGTAQIVLRKKDVAILEAAGVKVGEQLVILEDTSKEQVVEKLHAIGISITPEEIISSTIEEILQRRGYLPEVIQEVLSQTKITVAWQDPYLKRREEEHRGAVLLETAEDYKLNAGDPQRFVSWLQQVLQFASSI